MIRRFTIRRGPLLAMTLLAGLLLAADTLAWLQLQRLLQGRIQRLVQDAAQSGWQFEAASERRGGWPFAAELTFAAPRAHGADTLLPGGITWSGGRITATLSPLHPRRLTISSGGVQTVSAGGARATRDSLRLWGPIRLHLSAGDAGQASSEATSSRQASFEATPLHLALPGAGPDDVVTVAGLHGTARWTTQAHALTLALNGISRPGAASAIPAAALELSLVGAFDGGGSAAERLRAWRAGGGRLLLRQATMRWADAGIEASGHAALDGNLQPDGAFTVRITGADAMLDRLARSGRINSSTASAIRAVLGLIAAARDAPQPGRSGANDATARPLALPLALHAGQLSLGRIPLLRIPDLPGAVPSP